MKLFSRIFSMLILAFAFSVLFCVPTFAEESLSISVDGVAETELDPNTFGTSSVDVYVTSTSRDGYKLSISDSDENNSLVSSNGNSINPLTESVTESNFTTNAWGVKVGDNFLPVPKLTDNVLELANTTKTATNEKHTVTFGMKVDGTTTSGAYSSEVVFTAVANPLILRTANLQTGPLVNAAWKTLSAGTATVQYTPDNRITSIKKYPGEFTSAIQANAMDIATDDSDYPVWSWYDNGTIYYYTEADEVFLNEDSSWMFFNFQSLVSADFNFGLASDVDPDNDGIIASVQEPVFITSNVTNMTYMFSSALAFKDIDVSKWDTGKVTNMSSMFNCAISFTELAFTDWDTSSVTTMNNMFANAISFTNIDVSKWDTGNVADMSYMFRGVNKITSLDVSNWDLSSVTTIQNMFESASSLATLDVSRWDVSNINIMSRAFENTALTTLNVSSWNVGNVTAMDDMFSRATALTTIDVSDWDVSNVTDMTRMFAGTSALTTLDVSDWDLTSLTTAFGMFMDASALTALDVSDWDVSHITDMRNMFDGASSIVALDVSKWDTSSATNIGGMFMDMSSLTSIDVTKWNIDNVDDASNLFRGASSLTVLDLSTWDTRHMSPLGSIFVGASSLVTIYASDNFVIYDYGWDIFSGSTNLVGGNGTTYSPAHIDYEYARIDRPGTPGYFTEKRAVRKATLNTGEQVNLIWKSLAKGDVVTNAGVEDHSITSIQKYTGEFTSELQSSAINIADSGSDYPVWSWYNNGIIYYHTEADEVFFNADSSYMFFRLDALVGLNFNFGLATDIDPDGDDIVIGSTNPVYITSNVTNMEYMLGSNDALVTVDVSRWDTSNVTKMNGMFTSDYSLTTLNVSNWDTSNVRNMGEMFWNAYSLTTLDVSNWDTSNVTSMDGMFYCAPNVGRSSLSTIDVSKWDTSKVTSATRMFLGTAATALDVSKWDTSKIVYAWGMFSLASALANLDVSHWDTSSMIDMNNMFYGTSSLTTIDVSNWDVSNAIKMQYMFYGSSAITTLDLSNWDTRKVTSMEHMFQNTSALTTIYASDKFNTSAVISDEDMFYNATNLVGGNGTTYSQSHINKEYARIDTATTPGYFTLKPLTVYSSTLKTGEQVNAAWLSLANGGTTTYWDSNITSIKKFTGNFTSTIQSSAVNIATDNSDYPVWSWYDNGTIYYYTESDEVFLNADSSGMFTSMENLASMDFNFGLATDVDPDGDGIITSRKAPVYITSNVTNMNNMFSNVAFVTLDLSKWDTSSVTSMNYMFAKLNSLTTIYASNLFTTSAVTSTTDEVFYGTDSLVGGNGTTWDWSRTGKEYARIDKPGAPGYFTAKPAGN